MMGKGTYRWLGLAMGMAATMVIAACGGSEATATPVPSPTSAARPTTTPVPAAATAASATATPAATSAPATATRPPTTAAATPTAPRAATSTAAPAPTPTPGAGIPTPVTLQGQRGGTLQLPALANQPYGYDTFEVGGAGAAAFEVWQPMFGNLIQPDPYGDGFTLTGDAAERWEVSQGGKVLTFSLRKGIKFHDGNPLTSRDVAYNLTRAWKPPTARMTYFKAAMAPIQNIETPDESTVRITLSDPSNGFLRSLSVNGFTLYPAHLPLPTADADFKKQPIGTGPYKLRTLDQGIKIVYTRNDAYWKQGLPYLDGIVLTPLAGPTLVAAFRGGRMDATTFSHNDLTVPVVRTLEKDLGFKSRRNVIGITFMAFNQRKPWTDQRARQAVSLALDRQALNVTWLDGIGSPYASPLLPPELGGQWGIAESVMKTRPGFRDDKQADVAQAKALLAQAGVDPGATTVLVRSSQAFQVFGEIMDSALRSLGFKTTVTQLATGENTGALARGDFDINLTVAAMSFDDPVDYMLPWVITAGAANWGKWSNPQLDQLLKEQDRTLDLAPRKQMLTRVQEIILNDTYGSMIPAIHRVVLQGAFPWVKNYYANIPLSYSPRFRWEQVWLQR